MPNQTFEQALLESISHLRDVSLRDGIQSWDGNKWPIDNILNVVGLVNDLAFEVENRHGSFSPVELWGGGQVAQPAKFLKEDPFDNLERIKAIAPNLRIQCLYRGRQGFGFVPISAEVQEAVINESNARGVEVYRVFDMMNDISNLEPGITALKKLEAAGKPVVIEGAICYISEPAIASHGSGKGRAWSREDYAEYAVELARAGCHEITIKDYAGVGNGDLAELVAVIKDKLKQEHLDRPVNVHSHGHKPQMLADAIKAGAARVDVAFGDLSGGPSHTNGMEMLKLLMRDKGFDVESEEFNTHPIVTKIREIEAAIAKESEKFKPKRMKALNQQQVEKYRMAGGALSDLWSNYIKDDPKGIKTEAEIFATQLEIWKLAQGKNGKTIALPANKQAWFEAVLEECPALWEKAGRFNTVTPGALILCKQAAQSMNVKLSGKPFAMTDYAPEYLDVVTSRYGRNQGMERGVGDQQFRDAVLMFLI